ncbi:50S ribosomal protein L25 [Candidatus Chloroploca sp. M-50]|uniref:Large ribosomal subunit protein bL25 n=1 Tax=Candidatus Chloroploca mongolica TaxID=2528176 RepID=A0ABS4D7F6_9CHLR|nr:50S ribosomal protein L25 [Candidatus Chloroploca mongolica]MBP1465374.1 50S ribosomal protein L25 [Candidatus Chloroploca mongolica]
MRTQYTIPAQKRMVLGKKVKHLRTQGLLPATVYGRGIEPVSIQLDSKAFNLMFRQAGRTSLIDLFIDGQLMSVFVQDVQRHPVKRDILHVDFKAVDLKRVIQVEVPVIAVGESPVIVRGDALLNHALSTVMVEALPAELPQHIEVDISVLDQMDKSIHARDLAASGTYKVLTNADAVVLSLTQLRATTETEDEAAVVTEPELIRRPRSGDEE